MKKVYIAILVLAWVVLPVSVIAEPQFHNVDEEDVPQEVLDLATMYEQAGTDMSVCAAVTAHHDDYSSSIRFAEHFEILLANSMAVFDKHGFAVDAGAVYAAFARNVETYEAAILTDEQWLGALTECKTYLKHLNEENK